jgi:2-oxoglutarate ferredoxin oxidoreductase subunit delta
MGKAKGTVIFDSDACKGCGLCISVCPVKILALDTSTVNNKGYHPVTVIEPEKCIGCANCAIICPDTVITVYRNTEE